MKLIKFFWDIFYNRQQFTGPKIKVVLIGGGHCNCQVLKLLKGNSDFKCTLISDTEYSYYSGMIPGAIAGYYSQKDLMIDLKKICINSSAEFIFSKVVKVCGQQNTIYCQNGKIIRYDVLSINVGSTTKGTNNPGVLQYAISTRPIAKLLTKINEKEQLFEGNSNYNQNILSKSTIITPQNGLSKQKKNKDKLKVVICGAGAAGVEICFALRQRWPQCMLILVASNSRLILDHFQVEQALLQKQIEIYKNSRIIKVNKQNVILQDGRILKSDLVIWATGADPPKIKSDLALLKGFFRVNDYLQSTSHQNIFASGDCIEMESFQNKNYPKKAGVYAVRQAFIVANNIKRYIQKQKLVKYIPQSDILQLINIGDRTAIALKYGYAFHNKCIWILKNYIDLNFVKNFK